MSSFNGQHNDDAGCYIPNFHQRFFAARALELLPIHREVIHASQSVDLDHHSAAAAAVTGHPGTNTNMCFKKPAYSQPTMTTTAIPGWWPPLSGTTSAVASAEEVAVTSALVDHHTTQLLMLQQPCFLWPLLTMSPVFGGGGGGVGGVSSEAVPTLPDLLIPTSSISSIPSPQAQLMCNTPGLTAETAFALLSLPSSPPPPPPSYAPAMLCTAEIPLMSDDSGQLFARISEYRANGLTWQDISDVFASASSLEEEEGGGGGLSATQLSYLFYRQLSELTPQQQQPQHAPPPPPPATMVPQLLAANRFMPYTVKVPKANKARTQSSSKSDKSAAADSPSSTAFSSRLLTKLAYLNVDQFKQLQRLVSEYGQSNWDLIGELMEVRPGDLQKNWLGYSVATVITRPWSRAEIEVLALCRAIGVCCRTTAKLIGTKLPLQCRRKTIKQPEYCLPATSVHCPPNGPMYLVVSRQQQQQHGDDGQIEIDQNSLAIAREIVRCHTSSAEQHCHSPGSTTSGVWHILELAHDALPAYSRQTVSMCMLALLGSHPDYESGQQPPRSIHSAPPFRANTVTIDQLPVSPPPLSSEKAVDDDNDDDDNEPASHTTEDVHRWSSYEMKLLLEYVERNQGKKSWISLSSIIGTKTPAQCCNKYRSLRRYKRL
ncbi:hypothetical protein GGF42_004542 [Coemansia sp. RSA 2424]|nr:hypothetical protein GGF42_004542 [Coemansia sp. RSA 2424]